MPRFFIDTDDGHFFARDEEGAEFPDVEAARIEAMATLPEIILHRSVVNGPLEVTAIVRDETDQVLLRAKLSLSVERAKTSEAA